MKDHPYYKEVKMIVEELINNQLTPAFIYDGGDEWEPIDYPEDELIDAILATDDTTLEVMNNDGDKAFIYIVLGNEPGVAIANWSANNGDTFKLIDEISQVVYDHFNDDMED